MTRSRKNSKFSRPKICGTAYNLLNAFTEYTDHFKPVRVAEGRKGTDESALRADNALFGSGAEFKGSVLDAILESTRFCPRREIHRPLVSIGGQVTNMIEFENCKGKSLLDTILDNEMTVAAENEKGFEGTKP